MRKIVFFLNAGCAGTDEAQAWVFNKPITDDELSDMAWELAVAHAESYGIYPMSEMPEGYDEDSEDGWLSDQYNDNIEGYWEEYDAEKHDGRIVYGDGVQWLEG